MFNNVEIAGIPLSWIDGSRSVNKFISIFHPWWPSWLDRGALINVDASGLDLFVGGSRPHGA